MTILSVAGTQQIDLKDYGELGIKITIEIAKDACITLHDTRTYSESFLIIKLHENAQLDMQIAGGWQSETKKSEIELQLVGDNTVAHISLREKLNDAQSHTIITRQIHYGQNSVSRFIIRSANAQKSSSHYEGLITIEPPAIGAKADQDHKALLLSETAHAYARPTLEAKTNDVQCGHGSAIGYLDEEMCWYLASRGISSAQAQDLLIAAFLNG